MDVPSSPFVLDTCNAFAALAELNSPSPAKAAEKETQKKTSPVKEALMGLASTPIARRTRMATQYLAKAVGDVIKAVSPSFAKGITKGGKAVAAARSTRTSGLRAMTAAAAN